MKLVMIRDLCNVLFLIDCVMVTSEPWVIIRAMIIWIWKRFSRLIYIFTLRHGKTAQLMEIVLIQSASVM